jgi:AcrR family transcriptional regulator
MPRNAEQNAEIRNESRQLLIAAATKVFMRMGFGAARMSDIAREAGLSHGLTYHYFANKDAVFIAVVEATMARSLEMAREAQQAGEPAVARLHNLCRRMLRGARDNPGHSAVLLQAANAAAPEDALVLLQRSTEEVTSILANLIAKMQDEGDARAGDPTMLARTLLATLGGLANFASGASSATWPTADVVMRIVSADRAEI